MPANVTFRRELYLPRALVFDAWTGAEHLSGWYAPDGCRITEVAVEPVPGGRFALAWTDAAGAAVDEAWRFVRVERPAGFECVAVAEQGTLPEERLRLALSDLEDACVMEIQQDGVDAACVDVVRQRWETRLDRLERYFSSI